MEARLGASDDNHARVCMLNTDDVKRSVSRFEGYRVDTSSHGEFLITQGALKQDCDKCFGRVGVSPWLYTNALATAVLDDRDRQARLR